MSSTSAPGLDEVRRALSGYDEALVRQVAGRLVKPRNQWPVADLVERIVEVLDNPPVLDRRLAELSVPARQLLALIGHSRQPAWRAGNLIELIMAVGHENGLAPLLELLEAGFLYPVPPQGGEKAAKIISFEYWLSFAGPTSFLVFAPLSVAQRAQGEGLGLPDLSITLDRPSWTEADGLEWLLRLGALWQQVSAAPLRRTQQGSYFKRDAERLGEGPLLNHPPTDQPPESGQVPDMGFLIAALAEQEGILSAGDGEMLAGSLPAAWDDGLSAALASLWASLLRVSDWTALDGWRGGEPAGNPFPSAYLLALLALAKAPEGNGTPIEALEGWLRTAHPYWVSDSMRPSRQKPWLATFLLGVAYPMRLVQAARGGDEGPLVRLTALGRWVLGGGPPPSSPPAYARTLLVQPNLEVLAYRQGLTPSLVGRLTKMATWKTLGAACTLQFEPETVYRGLEAGESYESITQVLEQHGTMAVPPAVLDLLRTWSNKRDRIVFYPSAVLLEFASPADLDEAVVRGLPAVRLSGSLGLVASEDDIAFEHFKLTGTRDYTLQPERCVGLEPDGVTLTVDLARSDLFLETELPRFAEPVGGAPSNGRRQYRLTPASLASARATGIGLTGLDLWFQQRVGQPMSPAARLLLTGAQVAAPRLERHLVLQVATPEIADGLMQWPGTRSLIDSRLGPTALVVAEEHLEVLRERLGEAGIGVEGG